MHNLKRYLLFQLLLDVYLQELELKLLNMKKENVDELYEQQQKLTEEVDQLKETM